MDNHISTLKKDIARVAQDPLTDQQEATRSSVITLENELKHIERKRYKNIHARAQAQKGRKLVNTGLRSTPLDAPVTSSTHFVTPKPTPSKGNHLRWQKLPETIMTNSNKLTAQCTMTHSVRQPE